MEPTEIHIVKITQLKRLLKDHLIENESLNSAERDALVGFGGDEKFLLKYLIGRKMDAERAFQSILKYTEIKLRRYPEMFQDVIPEFARKAVSDGLLGIIKSRDNQGRSVMFLRAARWDPSVISLNNVLCAARYVIEDQMNDTSFLENGGILLMDCYGSTLSQASHFTVPTAVRFVQVFWKAYPIKLKKIIYINSPFFVRPVYSVLKVFLPSKLRDRVLITAGINEFHEMIEREHLPEFLGGPLSDEEAVLPPSQQPGSVVDFKQMLQ